MEHVIDDVQDDIIVGETSDRMGEVGYEWNGAKEVML